MVKETKERKEGGGGGAHLSCRRRNVLFAEMGGPK